MFTNGNNNLLLYSRYETVNIHLISKPDWYLNDINPLGLVPTLQMNDKIVYDSKICNDYLDEVYPGDKLVPSDPYLRARDKMLMEHYTKVTKHKYTQQTRVKWKLVANFQNLNTIANLRFTSIFCDLQLII